MVDALGSVQPLRRTHADSLLCQIEDPQRRFVCPSLLSGDQVIERNLKVASSGGEKVVIHIGNDRELVSRLELFSAATVSGKGRQPARESGSERA